MPRRPSLPRRLATATRWPGGVGLTSWSYMWRTTPLHRAEVVDPADDTAHAPPPLPDGVDLDEVRRPDDGAGPYYHRVFRTRVRETAMAPEALVATATENPNRIAPTAFAHFQKVLGDEGEMRVGDEYVVRMPGPWDGPVRVVERTPASWRFATLAGHLEAGQVRFSAAREDGLLGFRVETWTRSGDRLSNVLYPHLRMSKEIQLHMWTSVLERVVKLTDGRMTGGVEIRTWRLS